MTERAARESVSRALLTQWGWQVPPEVGGPELESYVVSRFVHSSHGSSHTRSLTVGEVLDALDASGIVVVPPGDVADAVREIVTEYGQAVERFAPFNSNHEGYAVLLEELDELWDEVRANNDVLALVEATQLGAMALRFLVDRGVQRLVDPSAREISSSGGGCG